MIKLVDVQEFSNDNVVSFKGHDMSVTTVAGSPDGQFISSGSRSIRL